MNRYKVTMMDGSTVMVAAAYYRENWGDLEFYGPRRLFGLLPGEHLGTVGGSAWSAILKQES